MIYTEALVDNVFGMYYNMYTETRTHPATIYADDHLQQNTAADPTSIQPT